MKYYRWNSNIWLIFHQRISSEIFPSDKEKGYQSEVELYTNRAGKQLTAGSSFKVNWYSVTTNKPLLVKLLYSIFGSDCKKLIWLKQSLWLNSYAKFGLCVMFMYCHSNLFPVFSAFLLIGIKLKHPYLPGASWCMDVFIHIYKKHVYAILHT